MQNRIATLTIAGSDCSGGAGVQADLKTFAALGAYGASVITALTAQNTRGVSGIFPVPPAFVAEQIDAVLSDLSVQAVKTGMLGDAGVVLCVAQRLEKFRVENLVVDPVMVSKSGHHLLVPDAVSALRERLLPLARLITPNLPEAGVLLGREPQSLSEMEEAAVELSRFGSSAVLLKGGHGTDQQVTDVLWDGSEIHHFSSERLSVRHTHGTGCTLSAAIACHLGRGLSLRAAVQESRAYLLGALRTAYPIGQGIGPVNHLWNADSTRVSLTFHSGVPHGQASN